MTVKITNQSLFDTISTHLLTQKVPAKSDTPGPTGVSCRYRYNNLSCAIGCLVKDDLYDESLESKTISNDYVIKIVAKSLGVTNKIVEKHVPFLATLQKVHDRVNPDAWRFTLKLVAKAHRLKVNFPDVC